MVPMFHILCTETVGLHKAMIAITITSNCLNAPIILLFERNVRILNRAIFDTHISTLLMI